MMKYTYTEPPKRSRSLKYHYKKKAFEEKVKDKWFWKGVKFAHYLMKEAKRIEQKIGKS
jgi:hypothetical protein